MANKDHSEDHDNISTTSYTDFGAGSAADPHDLGGEPEGELAEVPEELREDTGDETKTGLVSEFRDLSGRQMTYLVANRETSTALRSPAFAATALALIVGVLAALVIGFTHTRDSDGTGSETVAMMVPEEQKPQVEQQLPQVEQQLGMQVKLVTSVEDGQKAVKSGEVDAFLLQDPTGQGQDQILAKNRAPEAVLDKIVQTPDITYVDGGPVDPKTGEVLAWAMVALTLAAGLSLGSAAYRGLREERRSRMSEVIVAAVSPQSAIWGRIWGLAQLAILLLVITAVVGLLGLTVIGQSSAAVASLPAIGWFALSYIPYSVAVIALFALIAMNDTQRARRIALAIGGVVVVVMAFLPMLPFMADSIPEVASWLPFSEPTGVGALFLFNGTQWWQGLIAFASAAIVAVVIVMMTVSRYRKTVLSGAGIAGRPAVAKKKLKSETAQSKGDKKKDSGASSEEDEDKAEEKTSAKKADSAADDDD